MKKTKLFIAVGMAVALGAGLTACGDPYSGEGTVVSKQIDKDIKRNGAKRKTTRTVTDYEVTVDIPNVDANKVFETSKKKYETIQIGASVKIENDKIQ